MATDIFTLPTACQRCGNGDEDMVQDGCGYWICRSCEDDLIQQDINDALQADADREREAQESARWYE